MWPRATCRATQVTHLSETRLGLSQSAGCGGRRVVGNSRCRAPPGRAKDAEFYAARSRGAVVVGTSWGFGACSIVPSCSMLKHQCF